MRKVLPLLALLALAGCYIGGPPSRGKVWQISALFGGSQIVIQASQRMAGAIDSLTWRGMQFINATDHGREMQSAMHFDGLRECYNPTEAGSKDDGTGSNSSSKLLSISVKGSVLKSSALMAFWDGPGETSEGCPGGAKNVTRLSDYRLDKTVTISGNIVTHDLTFEIPHQHRSGVIEALAAYLPARFSKFWTIEPATGMLSPLSDGPGGQPLPIIISTPDGLHALGVYARRRRGWRLYFGRRRFPSLGAVKWNCVYRRNAKIAAGDLHFRCYSIVGKLDNVKTSILKLAK